MFTKLIFIPPGRGDCVCWWGHSLVPRAGLHATQGDPPLPWGSHVAQAASYQERNPRGAVREWQLKGRHLMEEPTLGYWWTCDWITAPRGKADIGKKWFKTLQKCFVFQKICRQFLNIVFVIFFNYWLSNHSLVLHIIQQH